MEQTNIILSFISIAFMVTQLSSFIDLANEFLKGFKRGLKALLSVLTCLKCVSFWIALFYTSDFVLASLTALIAFLIDNNLFNTKL